MLNPPQPGAVERLQQCLREQGWGPSLGLKWVPYGVALAPGGSAVGDEHHRLGSLIDKSGQPVALCVGEAADGTLQWSLEPLELAERELLPAYLFTEATYHVLQQASVRGDRALVWEGQALALTACWLPPGGGDGLHIAVLTPARGAAAIGQ